MRILAYEWVKLEKQKMFWVLSLLLLVANLITLYTCEKQTSRYFYVYEQKASFLAYQQGDQEADSNGYYQQDYEAQEEYINSYAVFINEMESRIEQMAQTSLYSDKESYVYRNLEKTAADFAPFVGLSLTADNCFGIQALAGYNISCLFALVFLAVLIYFVLFYERDKNLLLLLKGTRHGHTALAGAKLAVILLVSAVYTLLQEGSAILFLGGMYGYGDLARPLQAVSQFRNCTHVLSVGDGLIAIVIIRIAVAFVLAVALFCIGMLFKNTGLAVLTSGVVFGASYLFSQFISSGGTLAALKYINPFYCWDMAQVLGEYFNLNLLGTPVSKESCTVVAAAVLLVLLSAAGILVFHWTCQIKTGSRLEGLIQWLRQKLSVFGRSTSLLYYEFYKVLIQQKKGIVLILLLAWGIYEVAGVFGPEYYATADAASYRYYINQLYGPVTDETYAFLEAEETRLNEIEEKIVAYGSDPTGADKVNQLILQSEYMNLVGGFYVVQYQLEALEALPGDVREKYLLDEVSYTSLWENSGTDIGLWIAGVVVLLYLISGVYPSDEKKQILPLLRATLRGRQELNRSKNCCCWVCTGVVFLIMELPLFLQYSRIDGFSTVPQRLCDFTNMHFSSNFPLWAMIAAAFLLKGLSFALVGLAGRRLSQWLKSELLTILVGVGVSGTIAAVLYHFGWDINILLINLL